VVQLGNVMDSLVQPEVAVMAQSPHPLVTTSPAESTAVAHQGVGDSV
jgi:hypothetical protein